MKPEITKLVNEAKQGNKKSFTKLYNMYYRLIRYIIYNAVKDEELTKDLLSITFVKAYERIHYYVEDISFEAWLKTIAINSVIDNARKIKRSPISVSVDDEDNIIQLPTDSDPEKDITHIEDLEILKQALTKLRSKYRNLLEYRYFRNYSYDQLSAELHIPIGTVKSDLNKAKHRLRYYFEQISNSNKS